MTEAIHDERDDASGQDGDVSPATEALRDLSASTPIVKWSEQWWAAARPETQARRCRAHRKTGDRCKRLALNNQRVCSHHGGRASQSLAAARRRLAENADPAVRQLAKIAYDDNVAVETRLKATLALIDRSVGGAKTSVDIEIGAKPIDGILESVATQLEVTSRAAYRRSQGIADYSDAIPALAGSDLDIVDAEVVPEPHSSRVNDRRQPETPRRLFEPAGEPAFDGGAGDPGGMMPFTEAVERAAEMNRAAQARPITPRRALPPGRR